VIPAVQPSAPARDAAPPAEEPAAERAAFLLGAAAEAAGPAIEEPPPQPKPILLQREVSPGPVPAPAAAPPPAAPVAAPPPVAAPAPPPLPDAWTGEALRQVREARGLSVQQIAERTKVTRHHIENVEGDRFAALPAHVYLRGILLAIARELRLDGQKVARSYLERLGAASAAGGAPKQR
jgi:hypothetical protein